MNHGKYWTYNAGCRCPECRDAVKIQMRSYRARREAGRGSTLVSAREARAHLRVLRKNGFSWRVIGSACQVCHSTLVYLHDGRFKKIKPEIEDRILGLNLSDCRSTPGGRKPSAASYRLLEEFLAAGYSARWLRSRLHLDANRRTPTLRTATVERIQAFHDEYFHHNIDGFRAHCRCVANPEQIAKREAKRRERARKVAA